MIYVYYFQIVSGCLYCGKETFHFKINKNEEKVSDSQHGICIINALTLITCIGVI
jgi:predicted  nucleic acid-binding Zn-ribbon protein